MTAALRRPIPSIPVKALAMRAPLLIVSDATMTAAAALSPVLLAGAGGWVGAGLGLLGVVYLTHLRDSHIEADVRNEIKRDTLTARAPVDRSPPVRLRPRTQKIAIVPEPDVLPDMIDPTAIIRTFNRVVPAIGAPVEFQAHDWAFGELTYEGTVEDLLSGDRVKVRCNPKHAYSVPVAALVLREGAEGRS